MANHSQNATSFLANESRAEWHDETLWLVRKKRDRAAQSVPEWETLRNRASAIKEDVLSNLDVYLEQFEREATRNGANVLWASDANEFNNIIFDIITKKHQAKNIVKSKSMLTEECGLNHFLLERGIEVVDTDLGERIIQFRHETPSHIVLPAIHLKKEEIGETFHEKLGTEKGASDPAYLTHAARQHLRKKFLTAEIAMTGVNFAVAETGSVVVCTNEGNADMGVQSAPVQIHCMGIEKIVRQQEDLGVFMRLLARNATGQPVTTYISHYMKPKPAGAMYIVIVDNGRSKHLGNKHYVNSLKCIRCGGCMNTCPVFRRSGGHSYGYVIPGPIGSILAPERTAGYSDLPFASSLCGSCDNVCPVKIDIHEQLYRWRQDLTEQGKTSLAKRLALRTAGYALASDKLYNVAGVTVRKMIGRLPRNLLYMPLNAWGRGRELPAPPKESFKEWYEKNRGASESSNT
ncbi:MAG: lactate utilization protein [Dysgonamonadaceae bacterium]|jgi:L-lactate dehydrogenase complex protein LldF|nr:lactate utilization protein [Dysgonamonadaceae bacterium]